MYRHIVHTGWTPHLAHNSSTVLTLRYNKMLLKCISSISYLCWRLCWCTFCVRTYPDRHVLEMKFRQKWNFDIVPPHTCVCTKERKCSSLFMIFSDDDDYFAHLLQHRKCHGTRCSCCRCLGENQNLLVEASCSLTQRELPTTTTITSFLLSWLRNLLQNIYAIQKRLKRIFPNRFSVNISTTNGIFCFKKPQTTNELFKFYVHVYSSKRFAMRVFNYIISSNQKLIMLR